MKTFAQEAKEYLWKLLDSWAYNVDTGMTREKYYSICEQMGIEPNPDKIPPEIDDFPLDVQKAILVYNKLGDRVMADIGYLGKDMSALSVYFDIYNVCDKELFLDVILRLDEKLIKKSAEAMKAARDKASRK